MTPGTVAITAVNLRGIRMTARAVVFTVLAVRHVADTRGWPALFDSTGLLCPDSFAFGPLLLGMGRDQVISRRILGTIDAKSSTPVRGLLVMAAFTLAGSLLFRFQLAVELLNFGALSGFILVNLRVIRHYFFRLRLRSGWLAIAHLLFPILGAVYLAVLSRGFRLAPITVESFEEDPAHAG